MTHPPDLQAEILRLFHAERWRIGTIANQLGVHHSAVRRVLVRAGAELAVSKACPSKFDPFVPLVVETLAVYPSLTASRLYEMAVARGYRGAEGHFRRMVARHRPRRPAEAYLRLRTLPGEQAQVDWAAFGHVTIGRARRPLVAFVMVLSYSRHVFVRFFHGAQMANFLRGHVEAFAFFGGVPRELLYDNLKSAVLERHGDVIRFHPNLLSLAGHYRYKPKPVAVARGNEKGRVERAIQYVRRSFFEARAFADIEDLNAQALAWCRGIAAARPCPEDRARSVGEVFADERPRLLPLPDAPFAAEERVVVKVAKTPYVRFDLNDYSVPHTLVRRSLTVAADDGLVRVFDGPAIVATHPRSYDRGAQIEDPRHVADLVEHKREAKFHRGMDRLAHAAPSSGAFLAEMAVRQHSLGSTVGVLTRLLDAHGPRDLEAALAEAVAGGAFHLNAVRFALDRRRRERGAGPAVPIALPDDPRVRDLVVVHHPLSHYDAIGEEP